MITAREHGQKLGAHIKGLHATPDPLCERCRMVQRRCACGRLDYGPLQRLTFSDVDPIRAQRDGGRAKERMTERDRLQHEHQTTALHEGPPKRFVHGCRTCEMQVGMYVTWFLRNVTTPATDPFKRRLPERPNPYQPTEYRRRR